MWKKDNPAVSLAMGLICDMIIIITYMEDNIRMVSHGYNTLTGDLVVLPCVPLFNLGVDVVFDNNIGEYVYYGT